MNRNTIMKFRATEEEASEIRRKTAAAGMNVSKFLRTAAVNGQVVLYNTADVFGLRSKLKRIGNNINQIAMVVNSNRSVYQSDVRELKKAVFGIERKAQRASETAVIQGVVIWLM